MQLQSESGERSEVINNRQLRDLALNGRNILDLVKVIPGVVSTVNGQTSNYFNLGSFNVNGTRGTEHEVSLDGGSIVQVGANSAVYVTTNPDSLQEVRVLTSNYQAEYGKMAAEFSSTRRSPAREISTVADGISVAMSGSTRTTSSTTPGGCSGRSTGSITTAGTSAVR